jgi:hypothetical protein
VRGLIAELKATVELLKLNKQSQPEEEVSKKEFYFNPFSPDKQEQLETYQMPFGIWVGPL